MDDQTKFDTWLETCPVKYDYLSEDSEGQVAYVFFIPKNETFDDYTDPYGGH